MVGHTLVDIRTRLEELSVAVGPYRVVSAKTGTSPVPVSGMQFPTRGAAAEAASVATAYRAALRRYDPAVRVQDLIVCDHGLEPADERLPTEDLPEYCHAITATLLETLSRHDDRVQRAVMDRYLAAAERTPNRDRLSLVLVESLATAIATHLTNRQQYDLLRAAATQLPQSDGTGVPLRDTLSTLEESSLLRSSEILPAPGGADRVALQGYRLTGENGECIVLPVAVELLRRQSSIPQFGDARRTGNGWELTLSADCDSPESGLAVVPRE
jgi:hypothetical protein